LRLDIHGEEFGALLISAEGANRYSPQHAELIKKVREPFTIAMINARRYWELMHMKDLLAEDNRALSADIKRTIGVEVVGADFGLRHVMEQVRQIAPSSSPTLLLGETGTGKEVIANAIHMASPKSKGPMIALQCGAIPESLLDSELFGHEKGAFTGAFDRKRGRFERANGGTLFLDEIGELSLEAQVKLLRVLQEHRFERVGGMKTIVADVRVIAATHRDLEKMIREGRFREDLWYRLNVLPIRIPPLRLRREDIPSLVHYFVERKAGEMNLQHKPQISNHDIERLKAYEWPGNVRELQNIVERALILSKDDRLRFPHLAANHPDYERKATVLSPQAMRTMDEATADHINMVLEHVYWQVAGKGGAAEVLQMNPSTLRFRMKKLGIRRKKSMSVR
jgi:transcriptional regulator with GAF, ATPase, and Fis domain